jgi:hypothetical protein
MRIAGRDVKIFKIRNRKGFAALCSGNLTEGRTSSVAAARMEKALRRKPKRG